MSSYEDLYGLLIAVQIKRRTKQELRDHFLDKWLLIKTESEIVELLDGYESIRASNQRNRNNLPGKQCSSSPEKNPVIKPRLSPSTLVRYESTAQEKAFEHRVKPRCFVCNSPND